MAAKRQQIIECMDAMQDGMIKAGGPNNDIWQNRLIWWICKSVYLLLEDKIRKKR